MIIDSYDSYNLDEFAVVSEKLNSSIIKKKISSYFFSNISCEEIEDNSTILIAHDNSESFLGIAKFYELMPESYLELYCFMSKQMGCIFNKNNELDEKSLETSVGFRDYNFNLPIVYLSTIEAFNRGTRVGIKILDYVKDLPDIESIFLFSIDDKDQYYLNCGFTYTGYFAASKDTPIMYWDKSEVY